jgi:hypothetical protein
MIHPATELRPVSEELGLGVFVTQFIARGTLIVVRDLWDIRCSPERFQQLDPLRRETLERYARIDRAGTYHLPWDRARCMNHSCEPAARPLGANAEIALRDLYPGDELTCDYGSWGLRRPLACACRSPFCRGVIQPDDAQYFSPFWDAEVRGVLPEAARARQPLLSLLEEIEEDEGLLDALHSGDPGRWKRPRYAGVARPAVD